MDLVQLEPSEIIDDRPFTDLRHTDLDLAILRFLVTCVNLALQRHGSGGDLPDHILMHQPAPEHWTHRIVVTQPARLASQPSLTVVGFFGIKSQDANVALAQELDRQLIPELSEHDDLLAYVSVCLPTGNFGNLVLFASPAAKDDWGRSKKHAEAVRILTPDYYTAVRLYNGELPGGLDGLDALRLHLVKYYDYRSRPLWRAVRPLQREAIA